jgi:antitoxin component YwqK of YwqJK toxin-antitoxin module
MFGKKNGYNISYSYENLSEGHENGVVISRELYINDKREGISYYFYENGKLKNEISFVNGKKQGLAKEYDREGLIQSLIYYHNGYITDREDINRTDEGGLKQGTWKSFYPDGKLKSEKQYKDNMLNGLYKEFNQKGNLVLAMKYENDVVVEENVEDDESIEIRNEYNEQNRLVYSGPYRQNIPVGIHRYYHPDGEVVDGKIYNDEGKVVSEGIIDDEGKRHGQWVDFYTTGEKRAEGKYENNLREGRWTFYRKNGKIEQTGTFSRGRLMGIWRWYYEEGSVFREEEYFNGKEDGTMIEYSLEGRIITEGDFIEGEKEGLWYYKVGDHIEVGNYITGLRDGRWKYFYSDSTLKFEGQYVQGNADGRHRLFYENGNVKEERYYVLGIKERNWKKYDEIGNLRLTVTYKNDQEQKVNGIKVDLPESSTKLIR